MSAEQDPFQNKANSGPSSPETLDSNTKMLATFSHLGIVAGIVIPLGNILAPLIIWLTQKDKSAYVEAHAKEALNFQITMAIIMIASAILIFIYIGIILLFAAGIANLVLSIMAAIKANEGHSYEYPFNFRFIK